MRIEYRPTPEELCISDRKCQEVIEVLKDVKDIRLKSFILFQLVHSFKDAFGVDISQVLVILQDKEEKQ